MSYIPTVIKIAEIALTTIILWFVILFLAMPERAQKICQLLLLLIAILTVIELLIVPGHADIPPLYSPPSLIK